MLEFRRKDYETNKEYYLEKTRQWNKNNPEKRRASERRRRARKLGLEGYTSPEDIQRIRLEQNNTCVYCDVEFTDIVKYTVDHIIPMTREGSSEHPHNMQLLCLSCNSGKKDKTHEEYVEYLRVVYPERYEKFRLAV